MTDVRAIDGFPMYHCDSDGRVYSHITQRWLKPGIMPNGYLQVVLTSGTGKHTLLIHRIIARAFHGAPNSGDVVNHKNADRADNRPENLEWVTPSENVLDAYRTGLRVIDAAHRERCAALGRTKRTTTPSQEAAVLAIHTGQRGDQARIARTLGLTRYVVARITDGNHHANR